MLVRMQMTQNVGLLETVHEHQFFVAEQLVGWSFSDDGALVQHNGP